MPAPTRRRFLRLAALAPLGGLLGCRGTPSVLGYKLGAGALYDENIKTVYVPIFVNRAFQTNPYRGFENDITKAVIDEIGRTTSFRVTSDPARADTELLGVVSQVYKGILNRTQQNQVREGELVVNVDVVWRDLRDGTILSAPRGGRPPVPPGAIDPNSPPVPFDPSIPVPPVACDPGQPVPVRITATGRFIPELGETNTSAMNMVQNRIAVQIVSMMEKRW
ncbi:LPS assembly lipoprotein LptE [Gemmata sp.]|uniref:LptE family protein n=1 Tax=Gemmata sp. TaxID=1914242 RepID=UPI003F71B6A3